MVEYIVQLDVNPNGYGEYNFQTLNKGLIKYIKSFLGDLGYSIKFYFLKYKGSELSYCAEISERKDKIAICGDLNLGSYPYYF